MISIRPARRDELDLLSDLALRSKGFWGYDDEFLEACRAELTITRNRLKTESIRVAEDDSGVVGFFALLVRGEQAELMDLFVAPDHIGSGAGRALWDDAVEVARRQGATRLRIEADPNAEAWYRRRGAALVCEAPSGSIPGRMLPVLELHLAWPPLRYRSRSSRREVVGRYRQWLNTTSLPKLLLTVEPGAIIQAPTADRAIRTWRTLTHVNLGPGGHIVPDEHGHVVDSPPHRLASESLSTTTSEPRARPVPP